MLTQKTGHTVGKGMYRDSASRQRVDVPGQEVLTGRGAATYAGMSSGIMLLTGPVMGLLYAVLMPFIGIVTVAALAAGTLATGFYNLAVKSVSFGWRPGNAYLSGKKKKKDTDEPLGHC